MDLNLVEDDEQEKARKWWLEMVELIRVRFKRPFEKFLGQVCVVGLGKRLTLTMRLMVWR